ncbi:MAG: class I SAM-dependent methyltransferase [Bacteroidales bacterium]|nr:class I SAM-dependent methyltransferase [Bacteroidales bacterium]
MCKIDNDFELYLSKHSTPEDDVLAELVRFTNLTTYNPRMLSGHQQGLFLQMICQMLKPQNILEIGTFTGYSAICMARGVMPNGQIDTIEANDELEEVINKFTNLAGVDQYIHLHLGNALTIIPKLSKSYELVFIDGDKREYPEYYKAVFPKVSIGGYIIADNVLWNGKVINPDSNDIHTNSILSFNRIVQEDRRVKNVLLPMRDGLMLIQKIKK